MLKVLEVFHQQVARQITGMTETNGSGRGWGYPLVLAALEAVGIYPIMEYIRRRQATITEKVSCRLIYEICFDVERMPGTIWMMRWWDQYVVNEPEE